MKCLRCKSEHEGDICEVCGVNKIIYSKAINISNKYYNKGLSYAKLDNMTSAIESLEISVLFDKSNYYARNLLGLCQFAIGQTSRAIMNWEISLKTNDENNRAAYYLSTCDNDELQIAINAYNGAINYINSDNLDLAIIQLKRAIEKMPTFVDALNLLASCYMTNSDKPKALQLVRKVLTIDSGNKKALMYEKLLKKDITAKSTNEILKSNNKIEKETSTFDTYLEENKKSSNKTMQISLATFIIGALLTYMVSISLLTTERAKTDDLKLEVNKLEESNIMMKENYDKQIAELNTEVEKLTLHNEEYKVALENNSISKILAEAELLINTGNYKDASNVLNTIDTGVVKENYVERFEQLKSIAYENAKNEYYISGKNNMASEDYINATVNLEKALIYSKENEDVSEILYNLGVAYEKLGETKKALEYYNLIVEKYSESPYIADVQMKIAELN